MMEKLKIWYDPEGDFLEVSFSTKSGEFKPLSSKQVMIKVDAQDNVIGFAVLNVSKVENVPLEIELPIEKLRGLLSLSKLAISA
ncbi:DUF2283 domain-containing protein [candidate division LCP-89 bacterium B3_LCP]|uniref:DUF2283 domain-containing protein n=1 Tax=candidate division LCP-89 bacterium B3_LCP TaxID=2012998 RepID=A0A532V3N1_UNCL8|nr:MAG: DUF2283 domain-containing protein [candidate division LCP-89 bacterium B3_LCP]